MRTWNTFAHWKWKEKELHSVGPTMTAMPVNPPISAYQLQLLNYLSASEVAPTSLDRLCRMIWGFRKHDHCRPMVRFWKPGNPGSFYLDTPCPSTWPLLKSFRLVLTEGKHLPCQGTKPIFLLFCFIFKCSPFPHILTHHLLADFQKVISSRCLMPSLKRDICTGRKIRGGD